MKLVYGADDLLGKWVSHQLGQPIPEGVAIGVERDSRLIAAVVFHNYHGHMIEASIAATTPKWCSRRALAAFFNYPFNQAGVQRLQVVCRRKNKHARKFVERLGFKFEGIGRRAWSATEDAAIYSMLPHECRWIDGQEVTETAACA